MRGIRSPNRGEPAWEDAKKLIVNYRLPASEADTPASYFKFSAGSLQPCNRA